VKFLQIECARESEAALASIVSWPKQLKSLRYDGTCLRADHYHTPKGVLLETLARYHKDSLEEFGVREAKSFAGVPDKEFCSHAANLWIFHLSPDFVVSVYN
jgi:hypothetical protein